MEHNHRRISTYLDIKKETHCPQDATRCFYLVEFNVRHAQVFMYLPWGINKITDDCSMKLREYELNKEEWKIVEELRNTLKVHIPHFFFFLSY